MAAGLGFKTFNTGDVLSAADTNGYLMQGVLVFASAAARDAAITSPQEGQCCYLKDTDAVQTYSGSAWVGFDDSNAIQNSIVDAKGDIVAASGNDTPARLAVGSNGDTLVADSSAATGLRWQPNFSVGRNKIINGDFWINQRSFSSTTTNGTFGFDRWGFNCSGGTATYSSQTFTTGAAPVAGYEGRTFARVVTSGQSAAGDLALLYQPIESVRTLANQTITISFWAKASTGTPKIAVETIQNFGTGGSPSSEVLAYQGQATLSTSWARYSITGTLASISGKTIGTANDDKVVVLLWTSAGTTYNSRTGSLGVQNATIDIWGVQVEAGSVATPFTTATGTLQGELAACQRYYWRSVTGNAYARHPGSGAFANATTGYFALNNPIQLRISAPSVDFSNLATYDFGTNRAVTNITLSTDQQTPNCTSLTISIASGGTQYRPFQLTNDNNANGYIGISAEL